MTPARSPAGRELHKCCARSLNLHSCSLPHRCASGMLCVSSEMKHTRSYHRVLRGSQILSPGAVLAPSRSRFEDAESHVHELHDELTKKGTGADVVAFVMMSGSDTGSGSAERFRRSGTGAYRQAPPRPRLGAAPDTPPHGPGLDWSNDERRAPAAGIVGRFRAVTSKDGLSGQRACRAL